MSRTSFLVVAVIGGLLAGVGHSAAQSPGGSGSILGLSNQLNPAISMNALFLGNWSDAAGSQDGMKLQEAELRLGAVVDPYFQAAGSISFEADGEVGIEEGYVDATGMPRGLGLRAGKFYLPFGRHNPLHTHQFPFITPPLAVEATLGPDGMAGTGVELSWLLPIAPYVEVRGLLTDGSPVSLDPDRTRPLYGGRAYGLLDIGEASTLEMGASSVRGAEPGILRLGADLAFRWEDLSQTQGRALRLEAEWIGSRPNQGPDLDGFYAHAHYRFLRRWWAGAGWSAARNDQELRGQLTFAPSEFSALRGELRYRRPEERSLRDEVTAFLQLNFTIGAHPAHSY